jgi:UDP-N-acetylglucosamine 3-dehydrogenase
MKVGLIGCGLAAQFFHAPAYRLLTPEIEVVAVADPNRENRELVKKILPGRVTGYNSFRDMYRNEIFDLVDVMVPHNLYADIIPEIANKIKNILVEKPFATTLEEATKILDSTKDNNFSVVHNYLYGYRYKKTLEQIAKGEIGNPFFVRLENLNTGMHTADSSLEEGWRANSSLSGPGCFHDHGYHLVYLARALMGSEIVSVNATMKNYSGKGDNQDTGVVILNHENKGTSVLIDGRLRNNPTTTVIEEILGDKGTITLPSVKHLKDYFEKGFKEKSRYEVLQRSPFAKSVSNAIKDFVDSIKSGSSPPITPQKAYNTLAVVLAAYESHNQGQIIFVDRFIQQHST